MVRNVSVTWSISISDVDLVAADLNELFLQLVIFVMMSDNMNNNMKDNKSILKQMKKNYSSGLQQK